MVKYVENRLDEDYIQTLARAPRGNGAEGIDAARRPALAFRRRENQPKRSSSSSADAPTRG